MALVTIKGGKATIETTRLILREAQENDLEDMHKMFGDEEVMRYWSTAPHTKEAQTKKYLDGMIAVPCNGILDFIIVLKPTGNSIGKLGIWCKDPSNPEVGFMLARAHWNKGYMAEAMTVWLEYLWSTNCEQLVNGKYAGAHECNGDSGALDNLQASEGSNGVQNGGMETYRGRRIERVVADADPRNEACLGVLRKFGFKETGRAEKTFETHLGWCDSVYFELQRPRTE
ncbi:MAG: hypothetical protein HETSPECPRED_000973 [Heterodermia speciosa]|uniref:N-acetyltransferase domain-containing protein n=1 Tax=Heterodermia speciosa TaxID=116794 RepID=A0A8H3F199_9LECA|nr:MAG: hypothetical protein HETSPECPRED_000973 [Heterodermia speciosa]